MYTSQYAYQPYDTIVKLRYKYKYLYSFRNLGVQRDAEIAKSQKEIEGVRSVGSVHVPETGGLVKGR